VYKLYYESGQAVKTMIYEYIIPSEILNWITFNPCSYSSCFGRALTVQIIWQLSSFTGRGRPQVPFCAFFQAPE
jgi:hypothetical protein